MYLLIKELQYGSGLYGIKAASENPAHLLANSSSLVREHIATCDSDVIQNLDHAGDLILEYNDGKARIAQSR